MATMEFFRLETCVGYTIKCARDWSPWQQQCEWRDVCLWNFVLKDYWVILEENFWQSNIFYFLFKKIRSQNKGFHLFQYFWESSIIKYFYWKKGYWLTNNSSGSILEKNSKSAAVSKVFTLNLNIYFREQCLQTWKSLQSYLNFLIFLNINQPLQ